MTKSTVPSDLVTFTEEIFNAKLHFLFSVSVSQKQVLFLLVLHFFFCNQFYQKYQYRKKNTCYSIAIGEQEYSQKNTCVGVSF